MVIKQIRNAVQRELTYIQDQCSLLGLVHRLVLGHLHGISSYIASIIKSRGQSEY